MSKSPPAAPARSAGSGGPGMRAASAVAPRGRHAGLRARHTARVSRYLQFAIGFDAVTSVPAMPMFIENGILFAIRMIVATADSPHFSGSR